MKKSISIVCSMYHSHDYLREFHRRITAVAKAISDDYEIILVDDGSPDDSVDVARSLVEEDKHVRVVVLSRNFGHFKATLAGIAEASGDLVYMTNCDLEEPPELLASLYERMTAKGEQLDLVYSFQLNRKGDLFSRWMGSLFYRVVNRLAEMRAPQNQAFSSLMTRRYVDALLLYAKEEHILLMGIMQLTGFRQAGFGFDKGFKGKTAYNFGRKIAMTLDAITSFSSKPLVAVSILGFAMAVPSFLTVCYLIVRKIFFEEYMAGWTSLIASIWFVGGICIASIGLVGIYVAKTFTQVKQRPTAIVKEYVNRKKSGDRRSAAA